MGLLEPINTRLTDPQYFLDTPQQGRTLSPCASCPFDSCALLESHGPLPGFSPSGSHLAEGGKTQPPVTNGKWKKGSSQTWGERWGLRVSDCGSLCPRTYSTGRSWMGT